jgi:hypothetical protein
MKGPGQKLQPEPKTWAFVVSLGRKGIRKASRRYEGIRTAVVPVLIVVERTQDRVGSSVRRVYRSSVVDDRS